MHGLMCIGSKHRPSQALIEPVAHSNTAWCTLYHAGVTLCHLMAKLVWQAHGRRVPLHRDAWLHALQALASDDSASGLKPGQGQGARSSADPPSDPLPAAALRQVICAAAFLPLEPLGWLPLSCMMLSQQAWEVSAMLWAGLLHTLHLHLHCATRFDDFCCT